MSESTEYCAIEPDLELDKPECKGALQTVRVETREGDQFSLDTYGVNGRTSDSRKTLLVYQPWSDFVGREFQQQRLDLIAETTESLVIGVDNPGVGLNTSDLTSGMRRELRTGLWDQVSDLQWKAIEQNGLYRSLETDELSVAYYSLGATAAAATVAHAPEGKKIDKIILWESASFANTPAPTIIARYLLHGSDNWKKYIHENPDWVSEPSSVLFLANRIRQQLPGHLLYPLAMGRTSIGDHLKQAYDREIIDHDTSIHILNGTESKVSPTVDNDQLAVQIRRLPVDSVQRVAYSGETHGVNDSFPRVAMVLGQRALR